MNWLLLALKIIHNWLWFLNTRAGPQLRLQKIKQSKITMQNIKKKSIYYVYSWINKIKCDIINLYMGGNIWIVIGRKNGKNV